MPREQAFPAAQRLRAAGLDDSGVLRELSALGFPAAEARVAVGALPARVPGVDRGAVELAQRDLRDRGYLLLLLSSVLLGGGALGALTVIPALGLALFALGAVLLLTGCWHWWRASLLS
jgi:hypothetical protein